MPKPKTCPDRGRSASAALRLRFIIGTNLRSFPVRSRCGRRDRPRSGVWATGPSHYHFGRDRAGKVGQASGLPSRAERRGSRTTKASLRSAGQAGRRRDARPTFVVLAIGRSFTLTPGDGPGSGAGDSPVSAGVSPAWVFAGETPVVTAGTAAPLQWPCRVAPLAMGGLAPSWTPPRRLPRLRVELPTATSTPLRLVGVGLLWES